MNQIIITKTVAMGRKRITRQIRHQFTAGADVSKVTMTKLWKALDASEPIKPKKK